MLQSTLLKVSITASAAGHSCFRLTRYRSLPSTCLVAGLTESLHEEISPLGLRALVVEPGYFRTAFIESMPAIPSSIADYNDLTTNLKANFEAYNGKQPGDPEKGMNLLIDVVLGEGAAKGKPWVVRLLLGSDAVQTMERRIRADKEALEQWKKAASACEFDEKK